MRLGTRTSYWLLLAIGVLVVAELSSLATLFALEKLKHTYYHPAPFRLTKMAKSGVESFIRSGSPGTELDPTLGWVPKPSEVIRFDGVRKKRIVETINAQRIRATTTYSLLPRDGIMRIAAFGNSFTFGSAVSDEECWTERMNAADNRIEVLNFGVGGYGLDQAFLRYLKEGVRFSPHVVLICFMTENLARHVNVFRPFYTHFQSTPLSKPRFALEGDTLRLLDNPLGSPMDYEELLRNEKSMLAELGKHDYFYQKSYRPGRLDFLASVRIVKLYSRIASRSRSTNPLYKNGVYNTDSEAFKVTAKLIERFYNTVQLHHAEPVVVIFPNEVDVAWFQRQRTKCYRPLSDFLRRDGMRYLDLMRAFNEAIPLHEDSDFFDPKSRHYSSLGNDLVARYLLRYIREQLLLRHHTEGSKGPSTQVSRS